MTDFLLFIHSWLRWIILIMAIILIYKGFRGWQGNKLYTTGDNKLSVIFVGLFHLQVLMGLVMYFYSSPITTSAMDNFGEAMSNSGIRFWAVEHIFTMILAAVFVQIGRTKSKKARTDIGKHKAVAIYYLVGLILVLLRIPWNEGDRLIRSF